MKGKERLSRIVLAGLVGGAGFLLPGEAREEKSTEESNGINRVGVEKTFVLPPYPIETPTPIPTPTPEIQKSKSEIFDQLLDPFVKEAQRLREKRAINDPEWSKRVDAELNEGRVNFLLYGYGETYEPPLTKKALIGSQTIISYNTETREVDVVSFTHDIRTPEIERSLKKQGRRDAPVKIWRAYHDGGFELMREVLENASGLSIDFQVAFEDTVVADFIDQAFGKIEVEVPRAFKTEGFWYKGQLYPGSNFEPGEERMDGRRALQFIKTVPLTQPEFGGDYYGQLLEHNARKQLVFEAIISSLKEKIDEPVFFLKLLGFLVKDKEGALNFDFDLRRLLIRNLFDFLRAGAIIRDGSEELLPRFREGVYIVDKRHGDGGVVWVGSEGVRNPHIKKEIEGGLYGKKTETGDPYALAIPIGGNPYAENLAEGYWRSVRNLIKEKLVSE